jgi:hypothetical protein
VAFLKRKPSALFVQTNASDKANSIVFVSVSAQEVFGKNLVKEFVYDGIVFKQKSTSNALLMKGDSGTTFSLGGVYPLVVLSTVGDDATSGGASVIALPVRQKREGSQSTASNSAPSRPSAPNSANDREPTEPGRTTSSGGAPYSSGGGVTPRGPGSSTTASNEPPPPDETSQAGADSGNGGPSDQGLALDGAVCL